MKTIRGTKWLVTGAGSGIGRLMAIELARHGAAIAVADLDARAAEKTAREIRSQSGSAQAFRADVSRPADIKNLKRSVARKFGRIHGLINNAGIVCGGRFQDVPAAEHLRTYAVNTTGLVAVTHAFFEDLIQSSAGHLVNIASASGYIGLPYGSTYASSKWAVIGFSESIRLELAEEKINHVKVTTVCPSYITTGMFEGVKPPALLPWLSPERITSKIIRAIQKEQPFVKEPYLIRWLDFLKGILPLGIFDWSARRLGVTSSMTHWKGRGS